MRARERYEVVVVSKNYYYPGIILAFISWDFFANIKKSHVQISSVDGDIVKELPYKGYKECAEAKKKLIEEDLATLSVVYFEEKYAIEAG